MNLKKLLFLITLFICFGTYSEAYTHDSSEGENLDVPGSESTGKKSGIDNFLKLEFNDALSPRNFSSGLPERTKDTPVDPFGLRKEYIFYPIRHTGFDLAYLKIARFIPLSFPKFLIAYPHCYFT